MVREWKWLVSVLNKMDNGVALSLWIDCRFRKNASLVAESGEQKTVCPFEAVTVDFTGWNDNSPWQILSTIMDLLIMLT